MNASEFDRSILSCTALPSVERHVAMLKLHAQLLQNYRKALHRMDVFSASQPPGTSADQRSRALIVAHIAAWERYAILAAGDILAGVAGPRMMAHLDGYVDTDGQMLSFNSIEAFNQHQIQRFSSWDWPAIRDLAEDTASTFYNLYAYPELIHAGRIEKTLLAAHRLPSGTRLDKIPMGLGLWIIVLEHPSVEHAVDLGIFD